MPRGVNSVTLLGNVGHTPEIKSTAGGTTIANFSLATVDARKDESGKWVEISEWHRVVSFGKTAEVVKNYVTKGSKLYIEGKLQTRSWDDKDGHKKYQTEVVANQIIMLDSKKKDHDDAKPESVEQKKSVEYPDESDSLPF